MEYLARGEVEGASEIMLFILPGCHHFLLAPLGHPGRPHLGQQMDIECISKHPHLTRLQALGMPANASQALDPLRVVIFGYQLGPFPHPTHVMEPAPDGPSGYFQAVFGLELGCQRGTTPPRPAPAIGPRW